MPDIKDQFSFLNKKNQWISFPDKMLSMFFTATDHMKLSMTAKHVIFKPKKRRQQSEQEHGSASFCSIHPYFASGLLIHIEHWIRVDEMLLLILCFL